jgi:hypothetical protein
MQDMSSPPSVPENDVKAEEIKRKTPVMDVILTLIIALKQRVTDQPKFTKLFWRQLATIQPTTSISAESAVGMRNERIGEMKSSGNPARMAELEILRKVTSSCALMAVAPSKLLPSSALTFGKCSCKPFRSTQE